MANGGLRMTDGKMRMIKCGWKSANDKLRTIKCGWKKAEVEITDDKM